MTSFDLDALEREYPLLREYHERLKGYEVQSSKLEIKYNELIAENAGLRSALARTVNERVMATEALTRVQARCTELVEEMRGLTSNPNIPDWAKTAASACGALSPRAVGELRSMFMCTLPAGHRGWHSTWTHTYAESRPEWSHAHCPKCGGILQTETEEGCTAVSCVIRPPAESL